MEQRRGSSIWEKGVLQNGNMWIPSTPHKPVLRSPNNAPSEKRQNQIGPENWLGLVDMYEDILQDKQPHSFDLNISEGPSFGEQNHEGVPPIENYSRWQQNFPQTGISGTNGKVQSSQDIAPIEAYNMFPLNSNLEFNNQNVGILQELGRLNHNTGSNGTSSESHVHCDNHDGGGDNQQEILNSRPSMDKYASNMTPRSEEADQQLLIEKASTPEKHVQGEAALSSEPKIFDKECGDSVAKSMGTSLAAIATAPQEMGCSDGGIGNAGFDLNKTLEENEWCKLRMESSGASTSAANTYDKERQQTPAAHHLVQSINNVLPQEPTPPESAALTPTSSWDHSSFDIISRSLSMRNARIHEPKRKSMHKQVHHHNNHVFQSHPFEHNSGFRAKSSVQTTPQVLEDLVDVTDKQVVKIAYKPQNTESRNSGSTTAEEIFSTNREEKE